MGRCEGGHRRHFLKSNEAKKVKFPRSLKVNLCENLVEDA